MVQNALSADFAPEDFWFRRAFWCKACGAIFLNLIPLFTAAIAIPLLGECLVAAQMLGGLLVLLGVSLVSYRGCEKAISGAAPGEALVDEGVSGRSGE